MKLHPWLTLLRRLFILTGVFMFILHSFLVEPETSFTLWLNRVAGLFFFCGVILRGVEAYQKKHRIAAFLMLGIGLVMILDFVLLKFWFHKI